MSKLIEKPWGSEEIIEVNDRYVVKELFMMKGRRCSKQYHKAKRETIYVVSGVLEIHFGDCAGVQLTTGQSVTIPTGLVHRMHAITDAKYIEASTPELDDVVRVEDDYDRV